MTRDKIPFRHIAVEGPIGVGKTSLVELLANRFEGVMVLEDITNPFLPALVARFGLRPFLYGCLVVQLVLTLLMPLFDNLIAWFVLRGLMGAAVNGLFVISETWVNAVAVERSRGRVLAIYGAVLSGSFALGPLIKPSMMTCAT